MRRFWALVVMVLSMLIMIFFNVQAVYSSNNLSLEYDGGTEAVIQVTERTIGDNLNRDDISEKIMDRLDLAGADNYDVEVDGTDQVRISLSNQTTAEFDNVMRVVTANGPFSFSTQEDYVVDGEDLFGDEDPLTLDYDGASPIVAWNIGNDTVYDDLKTQAENIETEDENSTATSTIYVWQNKTEEDTYDLAFGDDAKDEVRDKVVSTISLSNYDEDNSYIVIATDENGNNFTIASARSYVTAYNAEDYGFDVDYLYSNTIEATYPANSLRNLLIGVGTGLLILLLGLIVEYGITGAISVLSVAVATLIQIMIMNFVGFILTPVSILAIVLSILLGVFININYFQRVKNELEKGKSIAKANSEGYRKSFVFTIEACSLTFILGLFMFFIGEGMLDVFGGVLLLGSLTTFLFSNFLTKWMTYWMMSSSVFSKEGRTFGLNAKPKKLEKKMANQTYVTIDKRKKHNRGYVITTGIIVVGLLAGFLTVGLTGGVDNYYSNANDYSDTNRLSISYVTLRSIQDDDTFASFSDFTDDICTDKELLDSDKIVSYTYNRLETVDDEYIETYTTYISVKYAEEISTETYNSINTYFQGGTDLSMIPNDYGDETTVESYVAVAGDDEHNNVFFYLVIGLTLVFALAYFLIVHGVYAALATTGNTALTFGLGLGLLLALPIPFNSVTMFAILFMVVVVSLGYVPVYVRLREIKKDERRKHPTIEQRTDFTNQALQSSSLSISYIYGASLLVSAGVIIFGGTNLFSLGLLMLILTIFGYVTTYHFSFDLYLHFANRFHFKAREHKKNIFSKKPIKVNKNEPHETVIPGIND